MTRKNPGAKIVDPRTDWEWNPLRLDETERTCVECGKPYQPTGRIQKYCIACKQNHKGRKHYGGTAGYKAFKAAREAERAMTPERA